jgi:hypothetical protein
MTFEELTVKWRELDEKHPGPWIGEGNLHPFEICADDLETAIAAERERHEAELTQVREAFDAVKARLQKQVADIQIEHEKQLRALVLEVLKHEFVWVKEPDKGQLVTEYGACSCGGLKADGVTPWKTLWKSHIDEIIKISLDRNHEQV